MKNGYIDITLNRIKDSGELSPACHFCGDSDEILTHGICSQCRKHTEISMSKLKDMYNKGLGPIFRHVKAMTVTDSLYLVQTIVPNKPIVWPHTLYVMGGLYLEGNGAVLNLPKKIRASMSVKLYNDADIHNMPEEITAQSVEIKNTFIQNYFNVTINALALSINAEKLNSIYWGNIHVSDLIELTNSKHITSLPENFEGTLNVSPEVVKTIPRHKLPLYLNSLCGEAKEALLKRLKGIS